MYRDDFYREPLLYDIEYADLTEDVGWYTELARAAGRVLELGCGTGRLTLPMARVAEVTGLDLSEAMLGRLRERARGLPVRLLHGDFRTFELGERFPLVVQPFNAIHHLYTAEEVVELMGRVRRHLEPGGRFALDAIVPDPRFWDRDPDGVFEVRRYADPEGGWMKSWENGFYDPITQINLVRYHYRRSDGRLQTLNVPLRMFYPQELLGLVRLGGFRVLRQCGDFRGGDLIPGCAKLVLVLEAA